MDDLRNPIAHCWRMGRTWRTLTIALLVLAVTLPVATPVMARECQPSLECQYRDGRVYWTAKGLEQGTWRVVWWGSSGSGETEFTIDVTLTTTSQDLDGQSGCYEHSDSFPHTCGPYTAKLYQKVDRKWQSRCAAKCEGEVKCKEERACRTDVSVLIYGGWNGIAVNATVGGSAQPTLFTALDAFGEPAVLWTFSPPPGETWTVVVTPQLPAGLSPEEWKYEPASRTVEIVNCKEYQVTFQLINFKKHVEVILPITGGEAAGATW